MSGGIFPITCYGLFLKYYIDTRVLESSTGTKREQHIPRPDKPYHTHTNAALGIEVELFWKMPSG